MDAFAVGRVVEPHCGRFVRTRATIVTDVDPQATGPGLLVARREHGNRCVVRMQLRAGHRIAAQCLGQRAAELLALTNPAPHARAVERDAVACGDLRLTVQRGMVRVLGNEDVSQQARVGNAALDRQTRHRRLREVIAAGADALASDRADHLEGGRDASELLGNVFADQLHGVSAQWAARIEFEHMLFARQMGRQRLLRRQVTAGRACGRRAGTAHIRNAAPGSQFLQLGLEPGDLTVKLLGLATKVHPLELVDLRLQPLDLEILLGHVPPQPLDLATLFGKRRALRKHQRLQRVDILREIGAVRHEAQFEPSARFNIDSAAVRRGCLQSMPSSNIES